uniref:ARAD1C13552p n=1 Tax=Blastobotrys adeninivorans TaxID=409370 RepID=A0A060T5L9_BLAAD
MDRSRVATTKLSHHRSRTPYDRPSSATAPSTPNKGSTPGSSVSTPSIFARAKNFFTPRAWRRSEPMGQQSDSVETPSADTIFKHPSPTIPRPNLDRFDQLAARLGTPKTGGSSPSNAKSPNEKLAEFFKSKGDKQLSDVETEGVLSLIRQAQSQNEGLLEFSPPSTGFASNPGQIVTSGGASVQATPSAAPSVQSAQSPKIMASPVSTPKYRPLYSSPGASRSNSRSSSVRSSPYTPGRRRFTNVSTPYRPSPNLRKSGLQQLVWENSAPASSQNGGQSQAAEGPAGVGAASTASELVEKAEEPKKELSQTASALLSLLGPEESKEEEEKTTTNKAAKQDIPEEVKEFINPYASATSRTTSSPKSPRVSKAPRTPRTPKTSKSSAGSVEDSQNSSSPAIKELEKTMPRDKHRPSRPSNLRNVVVADDKPSSPSNLFKFESPKQTENKSEKEGESDNEQPQLFKPNVNFAPISQPHKSNTNDKSDVKSDDKPEDKLEKPEQPEGKTEKKPEDKTESAPSLFSFAPPITSQTGFSFSPAKPLSTVVNGSESNPQESTLKLDSAKESTFKFGVPAEKPSTTAAEAPKPFSFGQPSVPEKTVPVPAPAPTIATESTPSASSHTTGNYSAVFVFPSTTPAPAPQLTPQDLKKLESYKGQFLFD